jgi:prolyl 4-hydroxylase
MASGIAGTRNWGAALERLAQEARHDAARRRALMLVRKMNLDDEGRPAGGVTQGRMICTSPAIQLFERLFSPEECDYLRAAAEPAYRPSAVLDRQGRYVRDPVRNSDGSLFHWLIEDPAVHALNQRIGLASGTAADQGEPLQILRYRPGEEYRAHLDFVPGAANQRVLTALVYLNHHYKGGETAFMRAGLTFKGRKGDAIVFRNARPDGSADPMSVHAGMPVTSGIKYLASRWIRQSRLAP